MLIFLYKLYMYIHTYTYVCLLTADGYTGGQTVKT